MMIVKFILVQYEKKRVVEMVRKKKGRGVRFKFGD
jgi:hypothetical protein